MSYCAVINLPILWHEVPGCERPGNLPLDALGFEWAGSLRNCRIRSATTKSL